MRYILEVAAIVRDPHGEPIRLGAARYYVEQPELSAGAWPVVGAGPTTGPPMLWNMPPVDGKPYGQISIECTLTQDPRREVPGA